MDRKKKYVMTCALIAVTLVAQPVALQAGVVLAPKKVDEPTAHEYPSSRFGEPAQPPHISSSGGGSRSPAGMDFVADSDPSAGEHIKKEARSSEPKMMAGLQTRDPIELIPDKHKGVQEVAIIAGDLGYFPKTVFVTRDIPVRMFVTGASGSTLCIMMDPFNVRKQVRSRRIEEINFTPSMPGKYRFYCPVNGMEGTLIVREIASHSS